MNILDNPSFSIPFQFKPCGCGEHVGVGFKWMSGTCVLGDTCRCGGYVGVRDNWVLGTKERGGHLCVGDLYSGGLLCLFLRV